MPPPRVRACDLYRRTSSNRASATRVSAIASRKRVLTDYRVGPVAMLAARLSFAASV